MSNKELKEQCIIMLVMVIIMGGVLLSTYEAPEVSAGSGASTENQHPGIIRLHVIANSNSEFDQKLKLKVRDEIISVVGDLNQKDSLDESRKWLESQLDDIEGVADAVIRKNGCNYRASAELGVRWIPEKTYGDMYFPAGNYEALTVTLGKGEGENWWCVLFPPLCLMADGGAGTETFGENSMTTEELDLDSEDQIKVKSWILEVMRSGNRE